MDKTKILVVDQDEASRNFLAQMLLKKNYEVIHANSGQRGIEVALTELPSVVIFDPNLPDLKAVDFVHKMKQNKLTAAIPCVALSSHSDPEEMRACLEAGCAEYYVKSGLVMVTMVDTIPKLLVEAQRQSEGGDKGLLIVFLSAKGGTGTSSLCANIGMNIAQHMHPSKVAVVDLVLPMGSIGQIVGFDESGINLVTVSEQEKVAADYLQSGMVVPPQWLFHLLPGAPDPETAGLLRVDRIPEIIETLRASYDYVLVDLGRTLSKISMPLIQEADLIALILSTDLSTATLTKKVWDYLEKQGIDASRMYAILNRAVGLEGLTKAEAEKHLGLPIKLMVPYLMGNFTLANNLHTPITVKYPTDTASMVLKQAAIEMSSQAVVSHR